MGMVCWQLQVGHPSRTDSRKKECYLFAVLIIDIPLSLDLTFLSTRKNMHGMLYGDNSLSMENKSWSGEEKIFVMENLRR